MHAHPTRLPAMDARFSAAIDSFDASLRVALRDAIREAMDSALTAIHKDVNPVLAEIHSELAPLHHDLALGVGGDSDPALMCSEEAESIEVSHQKPHNRDGNPLQILLTIHTNFIPPLLSYSPMLRALENSAVKPHSNNSTASTVLLPESKTMTYVPHLLHTHSFFDTTTIELEDFYAWKLFDAISNSSCYVVLDRDMCYCNGIRDKGGGSKFRSLEDCQMKLMEKLARSNYDDNIGYFIKKKLHVWCQLLSGLLELGRIRRHEVVKTDVYLNEINGWIGMYEVGKFVMALNAEKMFDEMPKRECENIRGTYFEFIFSLKDHREINFGALVIDLHADFFVLFTSNFQPLWDPIDALAQAVKLMLYL
ncbi:hypothetical protein TB1_023618 [Malus domestica]